MKHDSTTPPGTPTFHDAVEALLWELRRAVRDGERAAATLAMHREHVAWLYDCIPPETPLAKIDAKLIDSTAVLLSRGRRRGPDGDLVGCKSATTAKRMCTLRLVVRAARRRGWISIVPEFPRFENRYRPRTEHLRNLEELERLCAELPLERADWCWLAAFTGQHPGDVERMVAYRDADPFSRRPWFLRRNTKNRRSSIKLVMPAPLVRRLRARFRRLDLRPGQPIVTPWKKDPRAVTLRTLGARLGLSFRRATDLRHTCATWAAHELGSVTPALADWLGHSSTVTASRIYAHALPPALEDVAAALARAPRRSPKKVSPRRVGARSEQAVVAGPEKRKPATGSLVPPPADGPREGVASRTRASTLAHV